MITFDPYEIRARIIPTLIVLSPTATIPLAFEMSLSKDWVGSAMAGLAALALLYLGSLVVRFLGRKVEPALWSAWGGPPSTLVLKPENRTFPDFTKDRIRSYVRREFDIELDGLEENSSEWSQRAEEAFRLVRQHIRQSDPNGLWYTHNAEYGALRNFYGASILMAALAGLSAVLCAVAWWRYSNAVQAWLFGLSAILTVFPLVARRWLLPSIMHVAAFRYAESAWTSFLANAQSADTRKEGGGI